MAFDTDELDTEKYVEVLASCTCLNLRKAARAVTHVFDEVLRPCGLRSTQLPVLVTLIVAGSLTMTILAEELVMDRTSLARLLKPLEVGGFISILPGEDRRVRVLSLTARGQEVVAEAMPLWEKAQGQVVRRLGHRRWQLLHANLAAVTSVPRWN